MHKLKSLNLAASIIFAILITGTQSMAGMRCGFVHITQSKEVMDLVMYDAFIQWQVWEQTANLKKYEKPKGTVSMPVALLAKNQIEIQVDPTLPESIRQHFVSGDTVRWYKHPFNTENHVPFLHEPAPKSFDVYFTASRSMSMTGPLRGFTIKVPTNRPHGPTGELQTGKADTSADVLSALLHSDHIRQRDKMLGMDDTLIVLPEVLTVADKKTNIGYVIRDVRQTDDGHYYLPALSIPYVGREIADINRANFEQFWGYFFARNLGIAKGKLLLRYGLQMETPNPQNMLIQLDRNLKPTGRIAFRDLSDAFFVEPVAKGLGFHEALAKDMQAEYPPVQQLKPFVSNSLWRLDEAGNKSVSPDAMHTWATAHNLAMIKYVLKELDLSLPKADLEAMETTDTMKPLYNLLASPAGQAALKTYRAAQETQFDRVGNF